MASQQAMHLRVCVRVCVCVCVCQNVPRGEGRGTPAAPGQKKKNLCMLHEQRKKIYMCVYVSLLIESQSKRYASFFLLPVKMSHKAGRETKRYENDATERTIEVSV